MDVCLRVLKESKKGLTVTMSGTVYIDHIPYYLLGLLHALFSDRIGRGGGGQPLGNLTLSVFTCQFPHPCVSILSQIPILAN